jgi:RNA polymerase sigma-70 factor (ECF subfamily)
MNTFMDKPEREAIQLAQQGNAQAFKYLYDSHSRRVYRLCFRMVGNHAEAEDLTQEVFLQVFRKIQTFRGESALSTWLYRMTVNVVLMRKRKKPVIEVPLEERGGPEDERDGAGHEIGESDPQLVGMIDRVILQGAMSQLAPGYKIIFILHDVEGFKHQEIAEILGCSAGNSKSQLNRARMKLRRLLRPRTSFPRHGKSFSIQKYRCFPNERLAGTI